MYIVNRRKNIRLISCEHHIGDDFEFVIYKVQVQVKIWFGWVTIKEFEQTDEDDVEFISNEAEELYNKIVNNYSII